MTIAPALARFLALTTGWVFSFSIVTAERGVALRLAQRIALPGVQGRIDHLAADLAGKRLFLCALGNNSLEVIDLEKGARVHSISGLGAPQGVAYAPESGRLWVANDKGGICNFYDGQSFALLGSTAFKDDADNVRYDSPTKRIYAGFGNGGLAILEAETGRNLGRIKLSGHPEAFVLEKQGTRIFVNVPTARHVAAVDRNHGKVTATWPIDGAFATYPIALDETDHRLFVGCRDPAKVLFLNADSGAVVGSLKIGADVDDIFYDAVRHRLYAICGEGTVDVIEQIDRDSYRMAERISTSAGARTGLFVPEFNSLFVAVPRRENHDAEVRRYVIE